jgi:leucyl aminopeptidase
MEIKVASGDITKQEAGAIVVNLFEGVESPVGATGAVDRALDGAISRLIEEGEVKGKRGELTLVHTLGKMAPSRVLVAGLGKKADFDVDRVRSVSAAACRYLRSRGVKEIATVAHGAGVAGIDARESGQAVAEGAVLGLYRFDRHKSKDESGRDIEALTIVEHNESKLSDLEAGVADGEVLAKAVNLCRDMANEPANFMTPTQMAEAALDVARESGLRLEVLDRPGMEELGMGALLGVAQGSDEPPKLIVLRYAGDPEDESNNLGLLGKGITFDSGGISIKRAAGMGAMKGDMAGGAAVIAAMGAIGALKPKINVTAIVPATENMPGGGAQRPGDVVTAMNGKTIEIDNTDAEGRLVLADAVSYACTLGLGRIVDVATLTGAMSVALGKICSGAFGNDTDLLDSVVDAGRHVGERIWPMPTYDEYKDQYKSDVADIKNTGGPSAGSITGAQIIGEFAADASWVHLDIAGTSRTDSTRGYNPKGATGVSVRTLVHLAQKLARG